MVQIGYGDSVSSGKSRTLSNFTSEMNIQSKMNALYPFAEIVMFCINTGVGAVYFGKRDMSEGGAKMRTKCHVFLVLLKNAQKCLFEL